MSRPRRDREALGLVAGFGLWALGFSLLYGAHGLICSLALPASAGRPILVSLFALHVAAQAALAWRLRRRLAGAAPETRFVRLASFALAIAAAAASVWTGAPVLALSLCR